MIRLSKKIKNLSDEDLVRIIVYEKSHEEFGILYDRYSEKVYHKCISFVREQSVAQDLVHDIFLKTFINLSKFNFESKFSTWLYSLSYNFCVDHIRKTKKMQKVSEDELDFVPDLNDEKIEKELLTMKAERLKVVLDSILPEEKMILLMKYQDDLSIKDIMGALEIKESAVKMKISRARQKALLEYKNLYPHE